MSLLSKKDILEANDIKTKRVKVPEWSEDGEGEVIVSTMSSFAKDKFETSVLGKNGGMNTTNIRAKLASLCLVDEEGELIFDESDITKLGKKSCAALDRIFVEAQKLNSISENDIDDLAKN